MMSVGSVIESSSAPVLTTFGSGSPWARISWRARAAMAGSSSTIRTRTEPASAMRGARLGPESHPGELLPGLLAAPGIPQAAHPPVERDVPEAEGEGLQYRV